MEEELKNNKDIKIRKFSFPSVSVLGILISILLVTVIGTVLWQFIQNKKISQGLQGVYITDISDRSAVVSWVTSQPNKTELVYSNEEIKSLLNIFNTNTEYDRRDLEEVGEFEYKLNKRGNYFVHSVHLRNLVPQTEYYFAIRNGLFLNSAQYINTFSTIRGREEVDTPEVGYGNVYNQEGELISDTLLIFELTDQKDENKSQKISYVMNGDTGWSININNLLDSGLENKYVNNQDGYLVINIINSTGEIKQAFDSQEIKPAENISAYDNTDSQNSSQRDVKGIMAVLIPGIEPGDCICGTCSVSCPSDYPLTSCPSDWNCANRSFTCTKFYRCSDGESGPCGTNSKVCYKKTTPKVVEVCNDCVPKCPSGFSFTPCTGMGTCEKKPSICTKRDQDGAPCGTKTGLMCFKETAPVVVDVCNDCVPKCPLGFSFTPCTGMGTCEKKPSTCTKRDQDGVSCGTKTGLMCFKETIIEEEEEEDKDVPLTRETCGYNPDDRHEYYWCDCSKYEGVSSACVRSDELKNTYKSSCPNYCAEQTPVTKVFSQCKDTKNLIDKDGKLILCEYGCQENGEDNDDICKSKPIDLPQEVTCSDYTNMSSCRGADSSCKWSFADQKCTTGGPVATSCSSISSQSTCNSKANCEFVGGKCQEINLDGYIRVKPDADYCSGIRDRNGTIISISHGPESIPTHRGTSKCSIDINTFEVNLGNQIAGSVYNPETRKTTWKPGYSCKEQPYQEQGYGYSIIVTQPDGIEIRYAHLKYPGCDFLVTGDSGGWEPHLHVEVECDTPEECASCTAATNPCRAIAGGCFNCEDSVKAQAIFGEGAVNTEIKDNSSSLFSLISKIRAQEIEPIDPAILIKDLELPEGSYEVKSSSTSITTSFVKTDDNTIVFFEDANDNGKLDNDETLLSPYETQVEYQVSYEMVADSFKLVLQEGLNLVSFPIIFKNDNEEEIKKASELIEYLNNQGTEITTITTYRGGKFLPYVIRDGVGFGDDFNILPGEGYFVLSHSSGEFIFTGTKVKDGLEVQLYQGWNLVNIYNSEVESYSGFEILKKMKGESVGADILSKWEDGMYTNIVSEESGEYGTDFNVYQNRGYFVRVSGESGPFTPN